ncbi:MAG: flagellar export chaperone FlgN [Lachnospiraceae bacterium]|nr:flagellar export chaperone FlgN [Lachnospiraceae bacterium]
MSENYVDIMLQSLKKKEQVLKAIIDENLKQREILEDVKGDADAFDATVEAKAVLIEQLDQLDSGFEKLFARMKEELEGNKEKYADQIREIQRYIRSVTDKSVEIQAQEARNKDLMTSKFAGIKKQVKTLRKSSAVASEYYRTMARLNYVDPQFMDGKH